MLVRGFGTPHGQTCDLLRGGQLVAVLCVFFVLLSLFLCNLRAKGAALQAGRFHKQL